MDRDSRLESKLDKIVEKIHSIDKTLAEQHVSLVEHIKRTNILEEKLSPVETHVNRIEGALKVLGSAGAITALVKLLGLI